MGLFALIKKYYFGKFWVMGLTWDGQAIIKVKL